MLDRNEIKKIGTKACVDMLGKEFVHKYKDSCCSMFDVNLNDEGLLQCGLGMSTKEHETPTLLMGNETPMDYYAFVYVNSENGEVTRDYKNSTLPQ